MGRPLGAHVRNWIFEIGFRGGPFDCAVTRQPLIVVVSKTRTFDDSRQSIEYLDGNTGDISMRCRVTSSISLRAQLADSAAILFQCLIASVVSWVLFALFFCFFMVINFLECSDLCVPSYIVVFLPFVWFSFAPGNFLNWEYSFWGVSSSPKNELKMSTIQRSIDLLVENKKVSKNSPRSHKIDLSYKWAGTVWPFRHVRSNKTSWGKGVLQPWQRKKLVYAWNTQKFRQLPKA